MHTHHQHTQNTALNVGKLPNSLELSHDTRPDFKALSDELIVGGADTIITRFNIAVPAEPDQIMDLIVSNLVNQGCFIRKLGPPGGFVIKDVTTNQGVYFEARKNSDLNQILKLGFSDSQQDLPMVTEKENTKIESPIPYGGWGKKLRHMQHNLRRKFSKEPYLCGNVVINYRDSVGIGKGLTLVKFALVARMDSYEHFEAFCEMNKETGNYKVFTTGFLLDKPKALNHRLTIDTLNSLKDHCTGINLKVKAALTEKEWMPEIINRYDLETQGALLTQAGEHALINKLLLLREKGSEAYIRYDRDCWEDPRQMDLSLPSSASPKLFQAFVEILAALSSRGATLNKTLKYSACLQDYESTYLPGFPTATNQAMSLGYPGDLSYLDKS